MARQWHIKYNGALYHVLSKSNQGQTIYRDDKEWNIFLDIIGEASQRFVIEPHAYMLMKNHYHIPIITIDSNLSKAMKWTTSQDFMEELKTRFLKKIAI